MSPRPIRAAAACRKSGQYRNLVPDEKFLNFFSRGTFAVSDNAEIYTEFGYSKKQTVFENGFTGRVRLLGLSRWAGQRQRRSRVRPCSARTIRTTRPAQDARLRYAAFDVGPRITNNDNEFHRLLVGVKGNAGAWDYDFGYLHSGTSLTNTRTGYLRYSHVRTALSDPNSPVGYWRIGDDAGLNSQALYDYISPTIHADASTTLDMLDAKVSRPLMDLAGGSLGLALGAEYRRTSVELTPMSYTDIGDIIGLGYSAYKGTEKVTAAYAELLAPVATWLELSGALRFDSYANAGFGHAEIRLQAHARRLDRLARHLRRRLPRAEPGRVRRRRPGRLQHRAAIPCAARTACPCRAATPPTPIARRPSRSSPRPIRT